MPDPSTPQRHGMRFCKAFFELVDAAAASRALVAAGARELVEAPNGDRWYAWDEPPGSDRAVRVDFLIRMAANKLVLEGPTPASVGRGWRALQPILRPHAVARVAAGDDLHRFLGRAGRPAGDRPDTWDPDYERRVLSEFYDAFYARWATQPQARLGGLSPAEASRRPELRAALEELLARLARVQQEREQRGMAAIDVEVLRARVLSAGGA